MEEQKKMEEQLLIISPAPHIESEETISKIMYGVIIALIPAMISAVIFFGSRAVLLLATCVITCVLTEYIFQKVRKKEVTIKDGSAIITGILLALVLPPRISPFSAVLGAVVAIALGKQVFGGLGYNIFNPALIGRAFLQATFPVSMTTWTPPASPFIGSPDTITTATPLALMKFETVMTPHWKLFVGYIGGCLGETSALAILLGGLYLLYKDYIEWRIPAAYLGTVLVLGAGFWLANPQKYPDPLFHLLSGGLMLGAIFMATDLVTSPINPGGCWVFGIGAGVLVVVIRLFGGLPEGVMYSILMMNAVTPLINRATKPKVFGSRKGGQQ